MFVENFLQITKFEPAVDCSNFQTLGGNVHCVYGSRGYDIFSNNFRVAPGAKTSNKSSTCGAYKHISASRNSQSTRPFPLNI